MPHNLQKGKYKYLNKYNACRDEMPEAPKTKPNENLKLLANAEANINDLCRCLNGVRSSLSEINNDLNELLAVENPDRELTTNAILDVGRISREIEKNLEPGFEGVIACVRELEVRNGRFDRKALVRGRSDDSEAYSALKVAWDSDSWEAALDSAIHTAPGEEQERVLEDLAALGEPLNKVRVWAGNALARDNNYAHGIMFDIACLRRAEKDILKALEEFDKVVKPSERAEVLKTAEEGAPRDATLEVKLARKVLELREEMESFKQIDVAKQAIDRVELLFYAGSRKEDEAL
jgi:hypothetical protein